MGLDWESICAENPASALPLIGALQTFWLRGAERSQMSTRLWVGHLVRKSSHSERVFCQWESQILSSCLIRQRIGLVTNTRQNPKKKNRNQTWKWTELHIFQSKFALKRRPWRENLKFSFEILICQGYRGRCALCFFLWRTLRNGVKPRRSRKLWVLGGSIIEW